MKRPDWFGIVACGAVGAAFFALPGCVAGRGGGVDVAAPAGGSVVASPFSPVSMRIFPLTHFEVRESGEARVLLFLEFRDQWGDTVKGAGWLEVQLFRPEAGAAGREERALRWEIDLGDLDRNAALYDPSTRTYRLALKDLPGWLVLMARGEAGGPEWVALEAFLRTVGPDGRERTLRDRFVLVREDGG